MSEEASSEQARNLGRGALYLTATKLWFLVSGYVIVFGLPRILGDKALFGKYGVVTGLAAIANALVIQGTTQAVSRFVARDPDRAEATRRAAFRLQAAIGGGFFLLIFVAAPWIANRFWDDPALAKPLRWAGAITLFYAFYAVSMGFLNGQRMFARQAVADFFFSTAKVICVLTGAAFLASALGPITGAVAGFAFAAALVTVVAWMLSKPRPLQGRRSISEILRFQVFTMLFTFVTTFVARADLQILKAFTSGTQAEVDLATGDYYGAQQFSAIPYQLVFAITFVLFPLVSVVADRDPAALRSYIRNTTRYSTMVAAIVVALFCACPERTLMVLFTPDYASAAPALRVLVVGYLFFAVFFIMSAIITASGRPQVSLLLGAAVGVVQVVVGVLLCEDFGAVGVATGTACGMLLGFLLAHGYLARRFHAGVPWSPWFRTVLAAAAVGLITHLLLARDGLLGDGLLSALGGDGIVSKLVTVAGFAVAGVGYLAILAFTGVLGPEDRARLSKVLPKGNSS